MKFVILPLLSIIGLYLNWRYLRKALAQIKVKNDKEKSAFFRFMNYPLTVVWYGYLFAFLIGLTVNNLFLK